MQKVNITKEYILSFLGENKEVLLDKFQVKRIGLFGSYARGDELPKSDIDIVVDMPSGFDLYYDLKEFLEKAFDREVDLGLEGSMRSFIKSKIESEVIYV